MDTLKKAKEKYKQATSVIDLAVLLANKSLDIINSKVQSNAERVNKELSAGNTDKVRKFGTVYVDMLKNYMTYSTTLNLLVGDSHSANYERKMILRALLKSIESKSDKKGDYILAKVNALEKHIENSAKNIATLSQAVKGFNTDRFSGGAGNTKKQANEVVPQMPRVFSDTKNPQEPMPEEPVKNLADVANVLLSMSRKIEITLSEIRLVNKAVLKLVAKKGSFENMRTQEFDHLHTAAKNKLIKGGMDIDAKRVRQKIKILGGHEGDEGDIYVGGGALDQDLEIKAAWLGSYENDKAVMNEKPNYRNMLQKKLLNIFKANTEEELRKLASLDDEDFVNKIKVGAGVDMILQTQIETILKAGKLQNLLAYYIRHRNKYAPSKTELKSESFVMDENNDKLQTFAFAAMSFKDDYINLNLSLSENATVEEKLTYILDFVKSVMDALNKVDLQGIANKAVDTFEKINNISTAEQLNIAMDDLAVLMKNVEDNKTILLERKRVKVEIFKMLEELNESDGIFVKNRQPEKPHKGGDIGEVANYIFEKQLAFRHVIGAAEQTYNDQASGLAKLFGLLEHLASPDILDTCLFKSINFTNAALYVEVLPKVLAKRFNKDDKKLEEFHKYLSDKAKLPTMYKKNLDMSAVETLAKQLVDPTE